ncbi:MAG: NC domain protein, partial [Selenomonadaceae bacterium]|nr:NC domain protein [Selenomonadaceae bacterium]
GGKTMGLWGSIKSFFGFGSSSSRSSSSYNYNYEPDKVKIAEIERDTKLKLADKEAERIELMRDAQIELYKAQAISQAAIEKARVDGMVAMSNQMMLLQEKMLEVAKK